MKLTLLILILLATFILNVGCTTTQGQHDYLSSMFKSEPLKTYGQDVQECTNRIVGHDWYGNPIVRTSCNQ